MQAARAGDWGGREDELGGTHGGGKGDGETQTLSGRCGPAGRAQGKPLPSDTCHVSPLGAIPKSQRPRARLERVGDSDWLSGSRTRTTS